MGAICGLRIVYRCSFISSVNCGLAKAVDLGVSNLLMSTELLSVGMISTGLLSAVLLSAELLAARIALSPAA